MSMLKIHEESKSAAKLLYHNFINEYRRDKAYIYGFVEGKTDPSFYVGMAEEMLTRRWEVDFRPAGNRDRVLELWALFDWTRFDQNQILFFVDKDLADFCENSSISALNIYITTYYSIENYFVTPQVCKRVLKEIMGLAELRGPELNAIIQNFRSQLRKFHKSMIPIMANIIAWRRIGKKPHLNDIKMKDLFSFSKGKLMR